MREQWRLQLIGLLIKETKIPKSAVLKIAEAGGYTKYYLDRYIQWMNPKAQNELVDLLEKIKYNVKLKPPKVIVVRTSEAEKATILFRTEIITLRDYFKENDKTPYGKWAKQFFEKLLSEK